MAKRGSHGIVEEKRRPRRQKNVAPARRESSAPSRGDRQKKEKGKGVVIAVAIIAVIIAVAAGTFIYFNGIPALDVKENTEDIQTTTAIHETLVVVTVTDNVITYNSEEIASALELERRISQEENPTLSLVNVGADIDTYNAVATVLNKYGGTYEMMDKKNTNPSIAETTANIADSTVAETSTAP